MRPLESVGVLIAVPTHTSKVRMEWAINFRGLVPPVNCSQVLQVIPGRSVEEARNVAAQKAVELNAKYLFFLDDDVLCPNHTLRRFIQHMEENPEWDAISAIVPTKTREAEPCIFRNGHPGPYLAWEFNTVFPVDTCGMACCLIRTEALSKMERPWFDWVRGTDGLDHYEEGEDLYFCRKLKEAGGTIMADGAVLCGHMDTEGHVYQISSDAKCFRSRKARKALKEFRPLVPA